MSFNDDDYLELERQDKSKSDANNKQKALGKEYGETFSGDEQLEHVLLHIKSKINITQDMIDIEDIITSKFKKISRSDTLIGLTGIVGEWGVVSPIHVLKLEDDDCYMLLDGLRRVFASLKNGKQTIPAMVWDFSDKEEGKSMANVISLMINRSQGYRASEMWDLMQHLENNNDLTPGLIEFLLQMNAGEAMKLKDIMLSDNSYADIKQDLLEGKTNIEGAYKKLCNQRKKENKLQKDDMVVIEDAPVEEVTDDQKLSNDEVKNLLELTDEDVDDMSLDELNNSEERVDEFEVQDVNNRHPVDQKIKSETLKRDGFKCRCCGIGGDEAYLGILVYHHIVPVHAGGYDGVDNGLTLCANCHLLLHLYEFGRSRVNLDNLTEAEQKKFKRIFKYGNIAIEAGKRVKLSKDDLNKAKASSTRHLFPGEGLSDNQKAYNS